jgi:hypothetical protein
MTLYRDPEQGSSKPLATKPKPVSTRGDIHYHIVGLCSDLLSITNDLIRKQMTAREAKKALLDTLRSWLEYTEKL